MRASLRVLFALAMLLCWAACASPDAEGLGQVSAKCIYNSDCATGACVFEHCHTPCTKSSDCAQPSTTLESTRCVAADPVNVCLLVSETQCTVDAECPIGTVCAVDQQCRAGCETANDCAQEQVCSYRTCADENELGADGELPVLDSTAMLHEPCSQSSDCTPDQRCVLGQCDYECIRDEDCASGHTCGADHLCHAPVGPGSGCVPLDCAGAGAACGDTTDHCGNVIHCNGTGPGDRGCPQDQTCGGGGVPNQCGPGSCIPATACDANQSCGQRTDGCAGVLDCGSCAGGAACGSDNVCACTPNAHACDGDVCGTVPDGCGGVVACGGCDAPASCQSGHCVCSTLRTCANAGADGRPVECGVAPDGCGGQLDCGAPPCPAGTICGGGNRPNVCGTGTCDPVDASACPVNQTCGLLSNGCDGLVSCGSCTGSETCGGDGQTAGVCGCAAAKTCADVGAECGSVDDGCGGRLECGACATGVCGANGRCSCTAKTCAQLSAACGLVDDGCGGRIFCGACADGQYCGAAAAGQCGPPPAAGRSCQGGVPNECEVSQTFEATPSFSRVPAWYTCRPVPTGAPARVGRFALDTQVVTKRRYVRYAENGGYFGSNPPEAYRGRNPRVSPLLVETGWVPAWKVRLRSTYAEFQTQNPGYVALLNDAPVQLTWYEAFAFCIWDGGRLPTDAEWLEAAELDGRPYPWDAAAPTDGCPGPGTAYAELGLHGVRGLAATTEWAFDGAGGDGDQFDPFDCTALSGDCVAFTYGEDSRRAFAAILPTGGDPLLFKSRTALPPSTTASVRCAREVP